MRVLRLALCLPPLLALAAGAACSDALEEEAAGLADAGDATTSDAEASIPEDGATKDSASCIFRSDGPVATGKAPVNVAGTRLHLRHLDLDDGTPMLWDLFDATLNEPCRPLEGSDRITRCVPEGSSGTPEASLVTFTSMRVPFVPGVDAVIRVGGDGTRIWLGELYDVEHAGAALLEWQGDRDPPDAASGSTTFTLHPALRARALEELGSGVCCTTSLPAPCYHGGGVGEGGVIVPPVCTPAPGLFLTGPAATSDGHVYAAGTAVADQYCIPSTPLDASTKAGDCPAPTHAPVTGLWNAGAEIDPECFLHASTTNVGKARLNITPVRAASVVFPALFTGLTQRSPFTDTVESAPSSPPWLPSSEALSSPVTDKVANESCTLVELDDGELHCVGTYLGRVTFTDAACTNPAALSADVFGSYPNLSHVLSGPLSDVGLVTEAHHVYDFGAPIGSGGVESPYYFLGPDGQGPCTQALLPAKLITVVAQPTSMFPIVHLVTD